MSNRNGCVLSGLKLGLALLLGSLLLSCIAESETEPLPAIGGDWIIASSVGGRTPIKVYCSLEQDGAVLGGSCTPDMPNPEASVVRGSVGLGLALWGYDVVFNGNPGRVDFRATSLGPERLEGSLSLSGTVAPFTAERPGAQ